MTWAAALALVGLAACGDDPPNQPIDAGQDAAIDAAIDAGDGLSTVTTLPATVKRDLDLLFVVDNSGSMLEEQASLAANFPGLVNVLNTVTGGLANLHLGVVSTNVGSGGVNIGGCSTPAQPAGDDGDLLTNGCAGLTAPYLEDLANPDGTRARNYTGDLSSQFSCMAQLGTAGCGFEQPLESMRRALSPGKNPGFLRPNALLGVIIISDEDDCSALPGGGLFGDPNGTITSPLGPLTSFRCFEFGVQCDDDPAPRMFGTRTGCVPRTGSPHVEAVAPYIAFLRGLKADPRDVVVGGIVGSTDEQRTAVVGADVGDATRPALLPSCQSASGTAYPAFRLRSFFEGFPERVALNTICNDNLFDAMTVIGEQLLRAHGSRCIDADLVDTDPASAGLQPRCEVTEYTVTSGVRSNPVVIPSCVSGGPQPCWRLEADAATCPRAVANQALAIDRATPAAADSEVEARCEVRP
ncbi:MAG: hypothetical protein IPL61_28365 [Myxococcales bacterium]|nr:hypothetical protein [Myxococcales bacterium]